MLYRGLMCDGVRDSEGCRRVMNLFERRGFLAALVGHIHFRSEDRLGQACQFLTEPAFFGGYRVIDLLPWDTDREYSPTSHRRMRDPRVP